jgi:hypothetical protein
MYLLLCVQLSRTKQNFLQLAALRPQCVHQFALYANTYHPL